MMQQWQQCNSGSNSIMSNNAYLKLDDETQTINDQNKDVESDRYIRKTIGSNDVSDNTKKFMEEWYVFIVGLILITIFGVFCTFRSSFDHLNMPDWNIVHFWDHDKIIFLIASGLISVVVPTIWIINWRFTTSKSKRDKISYKNIVKCFAIYFFFVSLAIWIGHEEDLHDKGFSSAFWALLFGLLITNIWKTDLDNHWFNIVRKDADFFIKLSLVCLYVKVGDLIKLASRSILLSWVMHVPVIYNLSFFFGRLLKMDSEYEIVKLKLMAGCVTICGSSAVTAIRDLISTFPNLSGIKDSIKKDGDVIIAISSMATIGYMLLLPFLSRLLSLNDDVVGTAIGTCVDSTGQVIASAAMYSDKAKEAAQIVKMIQNIAIAPLCVCIAIKEYNTNSDSTNRNNNNILENISQFVPLAWSTFPKFVLGFVLNSIILSFIIMPFSGNDADENADFVIKIGSFTAEWFEIFAFFCIGLKLNYQEIKSNFVNSSVQSWIMLYFIIQTVDTIIAFASAYLIFGNIF